MEPLTYVYRTTDGRDLLADVYRPSRPEGAPVVLWLHGGGLIFGSRKDIPDGHLRGMLERGFVVVSVEYRLAPETKAPTLFKDVEAAYAWVRTNLTELWDTDPNRICLVGQSAGGYLSLLGAVHLRPAPAAVVSIYGYGDVGAPWYSEPDPYYCTYPMVSQPEALASLNAAVSPGSSHAARYPFYLYCRQQGSWPQEVLGLDPRADELAMLDWCPLANIERITSPVLLVHGSDDTDVPFDESAKMAAALISADKESQFLAVDGRGHGFDQDEHDPTARAAIRAILDFISEHTAARHVERERSSLGLVASRVGGDGRVVARKRARRYGES